MNIDEYSSFFWAGMFAVGMFVGGGNSKALASTIAFCLGLLAIYPDTTKAVALLALYIPAVLYSSFRS